MIIYFALYLLIWLKGSKITKIVIPIVLFYGNIHFLKSLCGVCVMLFKQIYCYYEKVICGCSGFCRKPRTPTYHLFFAGVLFKSVFFSKVYAVITGPVLSNSHYCLEHLFQNKSQSLLTLDLR